MPRNTVTNRVLNPEQQNLFLQSEVFSSASWGKINCTITANTTTAPDGNLTASSITESNSLNSTKLIYQFSTGVQLNSIVTASYYMKKNTRDFGFIAKLNGGTVIAYAFFDLNNGIIGAYSTTGNILISVPIIETVGSGWYRCSATFYNAGNLIGVCSSSANNTTSYVGSAGVQPIFIWGANFNKGTAIPPYKSTLTTAYDAGNVHPKSANKIIVSDRVLIT